MAENNYSDTETALDSDVNYESENKSDNDDIDIKNFLPKPEPDFNDLNILKWIAIIAFIYSFFYMLGQIINF